MNIDEIQICSPGPNWSPLIFNTDVSLENDYIVHAVLPLKGINPRAPYILKNVTGLDKTEITRTYNDGPQFYRLQAKPRTVSFQIKLNPAFDGGASVGDLRDSIYQAISVNTTGSQYTVYGDRLPNKQLELRFLNGGRHISSLFGTVSSMEANVFTDKPDLILEIGCDDPYPRSTVNYHANGNINNAFTGSHVVNGNTINVDGRFSYTDTMSTAPHGFVFHALCTSIPTTNPKQFVVWDERDVEHLLFASSFDFQIGDMVFFNSNESDRNLFVKRGENFFGLLTALYWGSVWPLLLPGPNAYQVSEGFEFSGISHKPTYWGV